MAIPQSPASHSEKSSSNAVGSGRDACRLRSRPAKTGSTKRDINTTAPKDSTPITAG